MKIFQVKGSSRDSTIYVGETLENVGKYMPVEKTFVISDTNVAELYRDAFPHCPVIVIGTGEAIKTLETVKNIYSELMDLGAQRSSFLLGIGGGIVCDVAGFAASTYLRGVRFGFVSTSLLSQVDASVGGKNGVNFQGYKNMVGVFNQPEFVICDMKMLKTLPEKELVNGFGEIVKHGAIGDEEMFGFIEDNCEKALALDPDTIERLVYDSVAIKADIVNQDEKEAGERRKLNFGHTFGHAIEKAMKIAHGEAVSIGMVMAASMSVRRGLLPQEKAYRLSELLKKLELPTSLPIKPETILDALKKDKKREGDSIHFILLEDIGQAVVQEIPIGELELLMNEL